jgi:hypothetical protein
MKIARQVLFLLLPIVCNYAWAFNLITDDEAKLPSAYAEGKRAGLTRGPGIDVASPGDAVKRNGVNLKVDFKPRGGASIDPKSVKVVYMKSPNVDLTERIKPYVVANGIAITGAQVPPGEHQLKVEVEDSEGRMSSKLINFKAE